LLYFTSKLQKKAKFTVLKQNYLKKGKALSLQAWSGPEGTRNLRFPDFMKTAQCSLRLSALRTGRLYPQEIHLILIFVRG
jgi:hypothetical protein